MVFYYEKEKERICQRAWFYYGCCRFCNWLVPIFCIFVKYVTPALILIIEAGGLYNEFVSGNSAVVYFAYGLIALCAIIYFIFFRNTYTGTNEDEKLTK